MTLLTNALPEPSKTITRKLAGVMAQSDVDVPQIQRQVVDAVRDHHSCGPTGKVMVKTVKRFLRPDSALAKQLPQMFFGLGINGEHGIADLQVSSLQSLDVTKLSISVCRFATRQILFHIVQCESFIVQPVAKDARTDRCPHGRHGGGNLRRCHFCKLDKIVMRVACRAFIQHRFQIFLKLRITIDFFFDLRRDDARAQPPDRWATH